MIRIGEPLDFTAYAAAGNDREVLRWITDQIMDAVMRLSGQEYVDAYGASVKAALAEGEPLAAVGHRPARRGPAGAARPGRTAVTEPEGRHAGRPLGPTQAPDLVSVDPSGKVAVEHGAGHGKGIYWVLRHVVLGPVVTKIFRPIEEGTENVPETGAAILASNHLSFADWLFMPLALDRRVTFVAKSDYFTGAGIKGWAQKRFFAGTGQVPIDRTGGRASEGALRAGLKVLRPRGAVRHLPRGHPQPRRAALQGPDRRGPAGPAGRRAGHSRRR